MGERLDVIETKREIFGLKFVSRLIKTVQSRVPPVTGMTFQHREKLSLLNKHNSVFFACNIQQHSVNSLVLSWGLPIISVIQASFSLNHNWYGDEGESIMKLRRPVRFYRSFWFWLSAVFLWVSVAGFPKTLVTVGDVLCYGILFVLSCAGLVLSFFVFGKAALEQKEWLVGVGY